MYRLVRPAVLLALLALSACGKRDQSTNDCTRGQLGCACASEQRCDGELVCSEGMCFAQETVTLVVLDERARGCEVLLTEHGGAVVGVEFGQGVRGTHVREAPKTAVVFIANDDLPISAGEVSVRFKADALAAPEVSDVRCSDQNGAPIEGAEVEIRG